MFRYEMHLHSVAVSACGSSESVEYVKVAHERGFAGMAFTNHFIKGNTAIDRSLPWEEFVSHYRDDYLRAKELGDNLDVDVFFGVEQGYGDGKECLIYGISPEVIALDKDFPKYEIAELSAFVRENGGFIACAHPFRKRAYISPITEGPDINLFDALEVYNRGNTLEDNIEAEEYAKKHGFKVIAGGDVHSVSGFGHSGVYFDKRVKTDAEFIEALKKGNYGLVADIDEGKCGSLFEYKK